MLGGRVDQRARQVMRERTERQNTETVLMKLLEESVEAIAIKADEDTLRQLHDMRKERCGTLGLSSGANSRAQGEGSADATKAARARGS